MHQLNFICCICCRTSQLCCCCCWWWWWWWTCDTCAAKGVLLSVAYW